MPNMMNISELVAGGYKQAACVSPFYPGLGMIKTMTKILIRSFLGQVFQGAHVSMGGFAGAMFFKGSGLSKVRLIKGQALRGLVFQDSGFKVGSGVSVL